MFIEILPAFLEGSAWSNMFVLDHEKVTWIEKILRPILIENGEINREAVARELLTEEDLDVIAHKQGLETVDEIKKCMLDANGNFLVAGKKDDKDEAYKKEILDKINNLTVQLSCLQNSLP